VYEVCRR